MFENIIGQDNVIDLLKNDIRNRTLNNSMIFLGEKYSGRLTTALEFTRILNCNKDAAQDCDCINCFSMKELNFGGLIFLSRRDNINLIREYGFSYNNLNENKFLNEIIRIIKTTALSLQDFLIRDSFSEGEKRNIYELLDKLDEIISKKEISSADLNEIIVCTGKLQSIYKTQNIPIDVFRAMLDWTYISRPDIKRVIIVDHADYLEKSSQNVLLKRLEEPSDNLYFILLAEDRNSIPRTILSRCRTYNFKKLSRNDAARIINNNFGVQHEFNSISNFLSRNDEKNTENIHSVIIKLFNLIFIKEVPFNELTIFLQAYKDRKYVKALLLELCNLIIKELANREINFEEETDHKILKKISTFDLNLLYSLLSNKYKNLEKFSLNPILLLEGIFYPLKAMVQNDKF